MERKEEKFKTIKDEIKQLQIDILGISEFR